MIYTSIDFITFENRIIQENDMLNQDEYVKLDKLNIDDFNLLIDLFRDCKSKDNYQEKNDLIELNLFNVKNLKNLKNLKIKILNKEDEGFICAFIHFISKLGLSSLNKVILEGNIQDVYLEGCLKQIIENKDLYKMLNYLMIKCKMLSGFNEIYENYHYQTYTLINASISSFKTITSCLSFSDWIKSYFIFLIIILNYIRFRVGNRFKKLINNWFI